MENVDKTLAWKTADISWRHRQFPSEMTSE